MSMSDCDKCWDTPCTCGYGYEKPRMSLDRLREVVAAATRVLADREASGDPEPVLHPQQQFTREQWEASIEIPRHLIDGDWPPLIPTCFCGAGHPHPEHAFPKIRKP